MEPAHAKDLFAEGSVEDEKVFDSTENFFKFGIIFTGKEVVNSFLQVVNAH